MTTYNEKCYWNHEQRKYGQAIRIKKNWLRSMIIILCLITPMTNWLIPLIPKMIRADKIIRYENKKRK